MVIFSPKDTFSTYTNFTCEYYGLFAEARELQIVVFLLTPIWIIAKFVQIA